MSERWLTPAGRDYLTPAMVAAELAVTLRTVERWISAGRLPVRRIGGRRCIDPADLPTLRATYRLPPAPTFAMAEEPFDG